MTSENNFYDHYKDSFEQQKKYLTKRDHYTIAILVMVMVLCLQTNDANIINKGINGIIQRETNSSIIIDFKYISVSFSYIYLWLLMQYYQICLTIEKTYSYIQEVEKKLSSQGEFYLKREGEDYLTFYPWLKNLNHLIYVFVFPLLFIFIAIFIVYNNIISLHDNVIAISLVVFANFLSVIVSLLYLSNRLFHEEFFSKRLFPYLNFSERIKLYFGIGEISKP